MLGCQHATRESITHQGDGFVPRVWLEAVNRHDDPPVLLHLLQPVAIFCGLSSRSHERTIRLKPLEDFPWLESPEHCSMGLVHGLMEPQTELADEQDDLEPTGQAKQREHLGLRAAIGAGTRSALGVRATLARRNHLDHASQRDERSLRPRTSLRDADVSDTRGTETARDDQSVG
jgi:hypothetical protein